MSSVTHFSYLLISFSSDKSHSDRVQDAILLFYRELVPRIEDREVLTWKTLPQAFLYLVPFFFMAYLVRRRETHLIRLLLLPTVLATTVWCTFGYKSLDPRMAWYEWVRGKPKTEGVPELFRSAMLCERC